MSRGFIDFRGALDKLIKQVRAMDQEPEAVSLPPRWLEYLALTMAKYGEPFESERRYKGMAIRTALAEQKSIAVIANGRAYLM